MAETTKRPNSEDKQSQKYSWGHVEASASYISYAKPELIEYRLDFVINFRGSDAVRQALELGFTTEAEIDEIWDAWKKWAEEPGAFLAEPWGEAIGWKDRHSGK